MSSLRVYILEDEALYANQLEILVDKLGYHLVGNTDNSDVAKVEIEAKKPDLVLMDVKVNGSMSGIDLATSLNYRPVIIFITSFEDEATFNRAKSTQPHAYLTKPFGAKNLQRTIELAIGHLKENDSRVQDVVFDQALFIKNGHYIEKLQIADILYLDVEDRYSTVYSSSGKKYVVRMSMGDILEKLPPIFMRIHRKHTINLQKVTSIDTKDNQVALGNVKLSISRAHKEALLHKLEWLQ